MVKTPSRTQIVLARLVVALSIVAIIFGLAMHGLSGEVVARVWQNMLDRPGGPVDFRFILQPVVASMVALRDGIRDARTGRPPFLWTILTDPAQRRGRLDEALIATSRIVLLGMTMDALYQFMEFKNFHPAEAVIIALTLAFAPYLLVRGVATRIARRWVGAASASGIR